MMYDCDNVTVRDALPDFVHGGLVDAELGMVREHLMICVPCAEEVELLRVVIRSVTMPAIDIARIAAAVPAYQAVAAGQQQSPDVIPIRRPASWARTSLRLAAGFAIAAIGITGVIVSRDGGVTSAPTTAAPVAQVGVGASTGVTLVGVNGLSDENLELLIQSMDQLEAVPANDPEADLELVMLQGGA